MEDISYDDEQVHMYLLKQHQDIKEAKARDQAVKDNQERSRIRVEQDEIFRDSEARDLHKNSLEFEEPSLDEIRRVRLLRFGKEVKGTPI